jgi:putative FmdB family regulatory protein
MPLYEYQCASCGQIFEVRQKFSDAPVTECKACGGPVKKLISQSGFALKGGGWYQQGYSGQSNASPSKSACGQSKGAASCSGCPKATGT